MLDKMNFMTYLKRSGVFLSTRTQVIIWNLLDSKSEFQEMLQRTPFCVVFVLFLIQKHLIEKVQIRDSQRPISWKKCQNQ